MALSFLFGWHKKKPQEKKSEENVFGFWWNEQPLFMKASYANVFKATNRFSPTNLIGVGSFGSVYKGILITGKRIAVKVIDNQRQGASKSFMAECEALGNIRHRNLVKLLTACSTIDFQEYRLGNEVSAQGDVYSYGILLLEMMTGRKPTDPMFEDALDHQSFTRLVLPGVVLLEVLTGKRPILDDDDSDLHTFARKALPNQVMDIIDPILLKDIEDESTMECLISMVRIGVACSMESPQNRMKIKAVIQELNFIRDILQGKRPPRKRQSLNLKMTWLPSYKESYCKEETELFSNGEPSFPIKEPESFNQGKLQPPQL